MAPSVTVSTSFLSDRFWGIADPLFLCMWLHCESFTLVRDFDGLIELNACDSNRMFGLWIPFSPSHPLKIKKANFCAHINYEFFGIKY